MNYSMPGVPVLHYLLEFAQTHVHCVGNAIQPISFSVILFFSCLQSFTASGSFQINQLFTSVGKSIGASVSVFPVNIYDWFPLGSRGLISLQSRGFSRIFSSTTVWNISSSVLSLLYGPTLTSIHDYWRNHGFDYIDLCQQGSVSDF